MKFEYDFFKLGAEAGGIFADRKVFVEGTEYVLDAIFIAGAADYLKQSKFTFALQAL